jgi:UDP-2-acetamido-2,6-beta-L-arabino-hexul-4-ose reductase
MKVLITGANGFIGKNLQLHLSERPDVQVLCFTRSCHLDELPSLIEEADFIFHLAGVNRHVDPAEFVFGNIDLTQTLCQVVASVSETTGRTVPVVYTSSTQAVYENAYGSSKRCAEDLLFELRRSHGVPVYIFRLPNVFGKWCRPNYNSVVATFCYNISRGLPIQIHHSTETLTLAYVDDVVESFIKLMDISGSSLDNVDFVSLPVCYTSTVGEIARLIESFASNREALSTERVGNGFLRALYSTYVSYLPIQAFSYEVPMHVDSRGVFVEMLKTPDCGQFSFFTAHIGITRGGHYHHTKTEKFLVIKGKARFKFRHIQSGKTHQLDTSGDKAEIVETVPGWTHDITNIGTEEMVVMLWANEVFDQKLPDTFPCPL